MINVFFQLQKLRNTITGATYYLLRCNSNRKSFFCLKQLFITNTYLIHRLSVEIKNNTYHFIHTYSSLNVSVFIFTQR